jgi:hypoxanthine phosphoribosyltransferase
MKRSLLSEAIAVKANAREVASPTEMAAVLEQLATEVSAVFSERCPVLLAVMRGGMFAATELARRLDWPFEIDYVHLSRYGSALEGGAVEWIVRPSAALRGRHVLIVDDILDRGQTLAELNVAIQQLEPASLAAAVLVEKQLQPPIDRPAADFVGLQVEDVYLFGCGMDYRGFWRGLPALYAVDGS